MSLPQRKKSAEEIAKLRETLGISGPPPTEGELPVATQTEQQAELQVARPPQAPALAISESRPPPAPAPLPVQEQPSALAAASPLPPPSSPKPVRSLRKSEQGTRTTILRPAVDSPLPARRHSEDQLLRIRRQEMLAAAPSAPHPLTLTAHLAIVIPGYLSALGGAVYCYFQDLERRGASVTFSCELAALAIATFIFFKKPLSRHHAAFIAVMALFIIIFSALYYFPKLKHGT